MPKYVCYVLQLFLSAVDLVGRQRYKTRVFRPTVLSCWLLLGVAASSQIPSPLTSGPVPPQPALPSAVTDSDVIVRGGLEFPNADVKDVLAYYERLTGKKLIQDAGLAGPVSIVVKSDLTKDEALRIIETSLLLNGFTLVPAGGDIIKVLGLGKNARGYGIPIISDELNLPESEQVVTFVYKLRFADPTEVQQILSQYIVPSQTGYNQLLALPKSQSLLITENTTIIRGLLKIIQEVDLPPVPVESIFIPLDRADAKAVVENLNKLLNPQEQPGSTAGGRGVSAGGPRPATPRVSPDGTPIPGDVVATPAANGSIEISSRGPTEDSIIVGKAIITPDERTNRIHVVTRPVNLPFIRGLIEEFDRDVPFGIPATRQLRFRPAGEIFPVIVKAITDPGAKAEDVAATGTTGTGTTGNRQTGLSTRGTGDTFGGGTNSFGNGSSSLTSNVNDSLETQPRETRPEAVILGSTRLIADNATNSIIVIGNQEVKSKVFQIIDELDVRPPQVMLHTVVGEITLGENEQFGVDYILRKGGSLVGINTNTGNGGTGGDGTGTGSTPNANAGGNVVGFTGNQPILNLNSLINQRSITQIAAAGGGGLTGFFTAGNTLDIIVSALESTNRFRVTSRPSVFAQNNQIATITSGQEIAIPGNIQSSFGNFGNTNDIVQNATVQYKTVALKLEILPLINSEREVTLDIVQRVDELTGQETVIGNSRVPTVATRAIKTHVSVPNQATLVLGGLIRQSQTNRQSGIPYLSRIPVVGALFRTTTKEKSRTELVILIRPEVTMGPCEDVDTREREMEFLNVDPDLETTLVPPNTRKRGSPEELLRRSQLLLRQEPVCVDESASFKK